jgi:hypothetical protein
VLTKNVTVMLLIVLAEAAKLFTHFTKNAKYNNKL